MLNVTFECLILCNRMMYLVILWSLLLELAVNLYLSPNKHGISHGFYIKKLHTLHAVALLSNLSRSLYSLCNVDYYMY